MQKIYNINALPTTIRIGMQTENGVESIGFDATEWIALWPDMELSVWVCAPGSDEMYEAVSRKEGTVVWWDVSGEDTAKGGTGAVTILGTTQAGKRKLSKQAETKIRYSGMQPTNDPPQSQQPWYVNAMDAARRAEEAAERAGKGGFSPIVDLKETQGGVTISITDEEGTKSAFVQNGKDGAQGPQGEQGKQGEPGKDGKDGTDATVTTESIKTALGYIPAKTSAVDVLGVEVRNLNTKIVETQASIPPIDTTLKKSHEAADAMTVGNKFAALSEDVNSLFEEINETITKIADIGKNLFRKEKTTLGKYINRDVVTDGVTLATESLVSNSSWWTFDDYIPCKKGDIFTIPDTGFVFVAGYQSDINLLCMSDRENYNEHLAYVVQVKKQRTFTIVNSKCAFIRISSNIPIDTFAINHGDVTELDFTTGVIIKEDVVVPQADDAKMLAEKAKEIAEEAKLSSFTYDYTQRGLYQFGKPMIWGAQYSVDADVLVAKLEVSALTGIYYMQRWTDGTSTGTCAFVDFANSKFGFKKTKNGEQYPTEDYVASTIPFNLVAGREYYVENAQIRGQLFMRLTDALTLETATIDANKQMYGANWGARIDHASDSSISIKYHKVYSLQPYDAHVLICGDSFIEGYAPNSYASLMKSYFNGSVFINGYSGGGSSHVVKMMNYLPNLVQPKYVIIAIGTNENDYDTWLTNIQSVLSKIETEMNGAIPVFATITLHTSYWNNDEFIQRANEWIRTSGHRYVDLNKITTVNFDGLTQDLSMFLSDGVHPTDETFAKMFERYKIDVPDLFVV